MRGPDPLHAAMAEPDRLGHRPAAPLRRLTRRLGESHLDHAGNRLGCKQMDGGETVKRVQIAEAPSYRPIAISGA